jgi:hypothetical protein
MAYASKGSIIWGLFCIRGRARLDPQLRDAGCRAPGARGRIRTAALNPRSLISRGGACQDGAWELA